MIVYSGRPGRICEAKIVRLSANLDELGRKCNCVRARSWLGVTYFERALVRTLWHLGRHGYVSVWRDGEGKNFRVLYYEVTHPFTEEYLEEPVAAMLVVSGRERWVCACRNAAVHASVYSTGRYIGFQDIYAGYYSVKHHAEAVSTVASLLGVKVGEPGICDAEYLGDAKYRITIDDGLGAITLYGRLRGRYSRSLWIEGDSLEAKCYSKAPLTREAWETAIGMLSIQEVL